LGSDSSVTPPERAVLLDTDVFSALFVSRERAERQGLPVEAWEKALEGHRVLISVQTVAESIAGALTAKWGGRRVGALRDRLAATPVVPVGPDVIDTYAQLTADCKAAGHPLAQKIHSADRWVASSAIAKGLPLLAGDGIYVGAPGLVTFL
jgi:predicted nucleic acid-binding protein